MSGYQRYVAIDNFSLNVSKEGKITTLEIKVGDALDFDGINVKVDGEEVGTAAALRKVKGEWIEAYNGSDAFLLEIQEKIRGKAVKPQALRTVIANSTVEHSSPDNDNDINRAQTPGKSEELKKIVNEPETTVEDEKKLNIVDDDQHVVKKVTEDKDAAEARSSSSVELSDASEEKKLEILSDEDSIAKETSYDAKESKPAKEEPKVSIEEAAVKETDYSDPEKTDIGSSTQAQVEKNLLDGLTVDEGDNGALSQDRVVVKKASPIEVEGTSDIESKLTVGGSEDGIDGAVVTESNSEIVDGEATFSSSGEDSPVQISEDSAVVVDSDDSIDVSALLDAL